MASLVSWGYGRDLEFLLVECISQPASRGESVVLGGKSKLMANLAFGCGGPVKYTQRISVLFHMFQPYLLFLDIGQASNFLI
jgi:hypothetical protein